MVVMSVAAYAVTDYTPSMMPNVQVADRREFVSDPAGLLSPEVRNAVNQRLYRLRQETTVEAVVAIPPSIGDVDINEWGVELFTLWGIGKKDKDNGVLLTIAPEQHRAFINTGYGVEGALPDIACSNIIGETVVPNMKRGDINAAVDQCTALMFDALTDPAVADELKSSRPDNYAGNIQTLSADVIWNFVQIIAVCVFLFSLALFCYDLWVGRRLNPYQKTLMWHRHLTTFLVCGVCSLGAGLLFWLLALFIYRTIRTKKRKCPTCGTKMHRLNEEEDNAFLTDSQDFEEKLKTVDYDVWKCDRCGTIERLPFKERQMKYTECPRCHTVAMCLECDRTIVLATEYKAGRGEKIYECKFCHNRKSDPYVIPKKESAALAAAAAAAAIASSGRRGGGGGFGGGFGGGATGGGGGGGSW